MIVLFLQPLRSLRGFGNSRSARWASFGRWRRLLLLLWAVSYTRILADVCSVPTFENPRPIQLGANPASMAVGDFNADGKIDLAVATKQGVAVLLGLGNGAFKSAVFYNAGSSPGFVIVGDLNGDGKVDLAVANQGSEQSNGGEDSVSILLGAGDGTFSPAVNYRAGVHPQGLALGDFNGDGLPDLAVANQGLLNESSQTYSNSTLSILLAKGGGAFAEPVGYYAGSGASRVVVADFDGDGKLDLAVGKAGAPGDDFNHADFSILFGKGDGTFKAGLAQDHNGLNPGLRPVAVGDFNGDGKPDLATTEGAGYRTAALLGRGDGTFQDLVGTLGFGNRNPANIFEAVWNPSAFAVSDFNGDGVPDIAVAGAYGQLALLVSGGDGSFQPLPVDLGPASNLVGLAVADFDGDGKPDLVVADAASPQLMLLHNNGISSLTAPVFAQMTNIWTGGFAEQLVLADFNHDGKLDVAVVNGGYSAVPEEDPVVSVLMGTGDGNFQKAVRYTVGVRPNALLTGDFNQDGQPDLITANYASGTVSALMGRGDGTFEAALNFPVGSNPNALAAGDFNNDGKLDLVVSGPGVILLGKGDGTFQNGSKIGPCRSDASAVDSVSFASGDFDGDGRLDLVAANGDAECVYLGNGDGTFQSPTEYNAGAGASFVAVGDFNLDGKLDVVAAVALGIDVLLGRGDGTFLPAMHQRLGGGRLVVGDLNRDGIPDLVVVGRGLTILLGKGDGTFEPSIGADIHDLSYVAMGDLKGSGEMQLVTVDDRCLCAALLTVWANLCNGTRPGLTIARDSGSISLAWPYPSAGYILESTPKLTGPVWKAAPAVPNQGNGQWQLTKPISGSEGYFRLRKP